MAKRRVVHRCRECGAGSPNWVGRCPGCDGWGTLVEELDVASPTVAARALVERPVPVAHLDGVELAARPTGIAEFDRVLGGGIVPGSVTVVGGEPGIGKSTLLTQVAAAVARNGEPALYVSAEESRQQVRLRAERLDAVVDDLWLASDTALPHIIEHLDDVKPALLVVDSIQTIDDPDVGSAPGSVAQVRECAYRLVQEAKARQLAVVLVGHVTKDGGLAGPRVLEHVVDTVLAFEGDRHHALRLLRAAKHRFGPTGELGVFEMTEGGLLGVADAGGLFLTDRLAGVAGSAVVPALEGSRTLLVEVQGLVAGSSLKPPRRSAQGLDPGRLAVVIAVLDQRAGVQLGSCDVFALAAGGIRVMEPAADLALALALASASSGRPVPPDLVACGELGLGGELRQVGQLSRRLGEAARLGFRRALVPASAPEPPPGIEAVRATTVAEAIALAGVA